MKLADCFAKNLRMERESQRLSQEQLADRAGLDRTYVSQLERGLKSPTLTTLEKLGDVLQVRVEALIRRTVAYQGPRMPTDYLLRDVETVTVRRAKGGEQIDVSVLHSAVNVAHDLIDELYAFELDVAGMLGLCNLSAFIGELVAAAIVKTGGGLFVGNPHQDGYPGLLLMDRLGRAEWARLSGRMNDKAPFSPFATGGIEVKSTCGSIPTPESCRRQNIVRPGLGDSRIRCLNGYDWKAHHRETNNLIGVLWDFIEQRPRIVAMFYSSSLCESDWGAIVRPRAGGGRTTSVSIMAKAGIRKMYDGWLFVKSIGGYAEFLNRRNRGQLIPEGSS